MKREETPVLKETRTLFETPYINIYDLVYEDGKPFPLVTWAGLMYFVSGMWEE